jgi:hypothetical protein
MWLRAFVASAGVIREHPQLQKVKVTRLDEVMISPGIDTFQCSSECGFCLQHVHWNMTAFNILLSVASKEVI